MKILMILAILVCLALLWQIQKRRGYGKDSADSNSLLAETAGVVFDFLDHGHAIWRSSGGTYQGTVSARLQKRGRGRYGYVVFMYDSGDVAARWAQTGKRGDAMELFVQVYGDCYDRDRDALVYTTRHSAKTSSECLERALNQRLRVHPLAEVCSNTLIRTKSLEEGAVHAKAPQE